MVNLQIELSEKWLRFVRSPMMLFVTALTGLSLTFAPAALYMLGKAGADYRDPRVIACFALIVLVPLVYVRLATVFIGQLLPASQRSSGSVRSTLLWAFLIIGGVAIYLLLK